MQKAIGKGCVAREHGYRRSNDCDMPVGGDRNTVWLPHIRTGPCGLHTCQTLDGRVGWASEAPPGLPGAAGGWGAGRGPQPRARPSPSHRGLSWGPWPCPPPLCSPLAAPDREARPLPPQKQSGLRVILAQGHSAFPGLDPLTGQVGNQVLSSFYLPVKSDLNFPGHCANLFFP